MTRKTISIEEVKEMANMFLASTEDNDVVNAQTRAGVVHLLERILLETENYNGYNFVEWTKEGGHQRWVEDGEPDNKADYLGDESRRIYY